MALLDSEQVSQDLNRRFAAPFAGILHYRRIIFWKDDDREFEDKLPEITLENATLVALNGTNNFAGKSC